MSEKPAPRLRQIYLYPTRSCSLSCRHCWICANSTDPSGEPGRARDSEISLERMLAWTAEARELGAEHVKITGGEPLLREDIAGIYAGLVGQGYRVSLETSGSECPEDLLESMRAQPPAQVSVSLDSTVESAHDEFRGREGSWSAAVGFIGALQSIGANPQVIMSSADFDISAVESMAGFLNGLGVSSLKINPMMPLGRGAVRFPFEPHAYSEALLGFAAEVHARFSPRVSIGVPQAFIPADRLPITGGCNILSKLAILPSGRVSLCGMGLIYPELAFASLREARLRDIWYGSDFLETMRAKIPNRLEGICALCMHRNTCAGHCLAENYAVSGRLTASSPICEAADDLGLFPPTRKMPIH